VFENVVDLMICHQMKSKCRPMYIELATIPLCWIQQCIALLKKHQA